MFSTRSNTDNVLISKGGGRDVKTETVNALACSSQLGNRPALKKVYGGATGSTVLRMSGISTSLCPALCRGSYNISYILGYVVAKI